MSRRAGATGQSDSNRPHRSAHRPGPMALIWITVARGVMAIVLGLALALRHDRAPAALVNFMGVYWILNGIVTFRWGLAAEGLRRRLPRELLMYVSLRELRDNDLPVFDSHSNDPEGIRMAAFTAKDPSDRTRFEAHWARIRQDPSVIVRTVVGEGDEIVGHASVFGPTEEREVTYWIGREYWGRGAATAAVRELLSVVPERPLRARAAADNGGSIRVLESADSS
jgi:RimJ/RimL family protein N-acetyltransferase